MVQQKEFTREECVEWCRARAICRSVDYHIKRRQCFVHSRSQLLTLQRAACCEHYEKSTVSCDELPSGGTTVLKQNNPKVQTERVTDTPTVPVKEVGSGKQGQALPVKGLGHSAAQSKDQREPTLHKKQEIKNVTSDTETATPENEKLKSTATNGTPQHRPPLEEKLDRRTLKPTLALAAEHDSAVSRANNIMSKVSRDINGLSSTTTLSTTRSSSFSEFSSNMFAGGRSTATVTPDLGTLSTRDVTSTMSTNTSQLLTTLNSGHETLAENRNQGLDDTTAGGDGNTTKPEETHGRNVTRYIVMKTGNDNRNVSGQTTPPYRGKYLYGGMTIEDL